MLKYQKYDVNGNLISGSLISPFVAVKENLTAQVNGTNTVFVTTKKFIKETLDVFLNGQLLVETDDYTIVDSQTIQFISAPLAGDKVIVKFIPVG